MNELTALNIAVAASLAALAGVGLNAALRSAGAGTRLVALRAALGLVLAAAPLAVLAERSGLGWFAWPAATPAPLTVPVAVPPVGVVAVPIGDVRTLVAATPTDDFADTTELDLGGLAAWLIAVWVAGVVAHVLWIGLGVVVLARLRRTLVPWTAPAGAAIADDCARRAGLAATPRLAESDLVPAPMVIGAVRPVVAFPTGLLDRLPAAQQRAILVHEFAHLAHRDPWVLWLQQAARAAFWWCWPVHRLNRHLRQASEQACDAAVVRATGDARTYAGVLVDLAEALVARRPLPATVGLLETAGDLEQRVSAVLSGAATQPEDRRRGVVLGAVAGLVTLLAIAVLNVRAADPPPTGPTSRPVVAPSSLTITVTNGVKTVTAEEPDRRVQIRHGPRQIEVQITARQGARLGPTRTFRAASPADLKTKHPEAYAVWEQYRTGDAAQGQQVELNIPENGTATGTIVTSGPPNGDAPPPGFQPLTEEQIKALMADPALAGRIKALVQGAAPVADVSPAVFVCVIRARRDNPTPQDLVEPVEMPWVYAAIRADGYQFAYRERPWLKLGSRPASVFRAAATPLQVEASAVPTDRGFTVQLGGKGYTPPAPFPLDPLNNVIVHRLGPDLYLAAWCTTSLVGGGAGVEAPNTH